MIGDPRLRASQRTRRVTGRVGGGPASPRTPWVDVSERFLPSGHLSLYENGSFGEKSELALLAALRVAFFLTFFDFLVGFFATLDFLVFLAMVITILREGGGV